MRNVVGYVQVSTFGQSKDGNSLQYQVDEIKQYDEEGLTVEREGLQSMLADLSLMNIQHAIVLNTSRLWRSDNAKVLIQHELKRNQFDVKAIEHPNYIMYAYDPNDFLVKGMLELLDQYQRSAWRLP